jgi:hypothetical protein
MARGTLRVRSELSLCVGSGAPINANQAAGIAIGQPEEGRTPFVPRHEHRDFVLGGLVG